MWQLCIYIYMCSRAFVLVLYTFERHRRVYLLRGGWLNSFCFSDAISKVDLQPLMSATRLVSLSIDATNEQAKEGGSLEDGGVEAFTKGMPHLKELYHET